MFEQLALEAVVSYLQFIWAYALVSVNWTTISRIFAGTRADDHSVSANSTHEQATEHILLALLSPAHASEAWPAVDLSIAFDLRLNSLPLLVGQNPQFGDFNDYPLFF